ncbi:MAG: L,D-transpeptidase family protein [Paracoccaceae bacterium]|nr:L,D-transpeptidase family protein [Paracoccaceae bacterium]
MRAVRFLILMVLAFGIASCGHNKFKAYNGPSVTQIQVYKSRRIMYLMHDHTLLASYRIYLGANPTGAKQFEGDGKTPEGLYYIDRRNPQSSFHLSLGISYPNDKDKAAAEAAGESPGGDIFIHGESGRATKQSDWTAGCIAVSNKDIEDVYAMVRDGTPIFLMP